MAQNTNRYSRKFARRILQNVPKLQTPSAKLDLTMARNWEDLASVAGKLHDQFATYRKQNTVRQAELDAMGIDFEHDPDGITKMPDFPEGGGAYYNEAYNNVLSHRYLNSLEVDIKSSQEAIYAENLKNVGKMTALLQNNAASILKNIPDEYQGRAETIIKKQTELYISNAVQTKTLKEHQAAMQGLKEDADILKNDIYNEYLKATPDLEEIKNLETKIEQIYQSLVLNGEADEKGIERYEIEIEGLKNSGTILQAVAARDPKTNEYINSVQELIHLRSALLQIGEEATIKSITYIGEAAKINEEIHTAHSLSKLIRDPQQRDAIAVKINEVINRRKDAGKLTQTELDEKDYMDWLSDGNSGVWQKPSIQESVIENEAKLISGDKAGGSWNLATIDAKSAPMWIAQQMFIIERHGVFSKYHANLFDNTMLTATPNQLLHIYVPFYMRVKTHMDSSGENIGRLWIDNLDSYNQGVLAQMSTIFIPREATQDEEERKKLAIDIQNTFTKFRNAVRDKKAVYSKLATLPEFNVENTEEEFKDHLADLIGEHLHNKYKARGVSGLHDALLAHMLPWLHSVEVDNIKKINEEIEDKIDLYQEKLTNHPRLINNIAGGVNLSKEDGAEHFFIDVRDIDYSSNIAQKAVDHSRAISLNKATLKQGSDKFGYENSIMQGIIMNVLREANLDLSLLGVDVTSTLEEHIDETYSRFLDTGTKITDEDRKNLSIDGVAIIYGKTIQLIKLPEDRLVDTKHGPLYGIQFINDKGDPENPIIMIDPIFDKENKILSFRAKEEVAEIKDELELSQARARELKINEESFKTVAEQYESNMQNQTIHRKHNQDRMIAALRIVGHPKTNSSMELILKNDLIFKPNAKGYDVMFTVSHIMGHIFPSGVSADIVPPGYTGTVKYPIDSSLTPSKVDSGSNFMNEIGIVESKSGTLVDRTGATRVFGQNIDTGIWQINKAHGALKNVLKRINENKEDPNSNRKFMEKIKRVEEYMNRHFKEKFDLGTSTPYEYRGFKVEDLEYVDMDTPIYAAIITRLHLMTFPKPISQHVVGRAIFWKKKFNTVEGKGTVEGYLKALGISRDRRERLIKEYVQIAPQEFIGLEQKNFGGLIWNFITKKIGQSDLDMMIWR